MGESLARRQASIRTTGRYVRLEACLTLGGTIEDMAHFQEPGWFTKHVFNRLVAGATRLGLSVAGSRVLEVKGRKSGEWRQTPVNLLVFEGDRYLVAPRGTTQWCAICASPVAAASWWGAGSRSSRRPRSPRPSVHPSCAPTWEKWKWEVGAFFDGVGPDSSDAELLRIAPDHPAFKLD
jgi:hypothetical protein